MPEVVSSELRPTAAGVSDAVVRDVADGSAGGHVAQRSHWDRQDVLCAGDCSMPPRSGAPAGRRASLSDAWSRCTRERDVPSSNSYRVTANGSEAGPRRPIGDSGGRIDAALGGETVNRAVQFGPRLLGTGGAPALPAVFGWVRL